MFEAKGREYFQGLYDNFLVPATGVPKTIKPVFSMELLAISDMSEVGSEHNICIWAFLRLTKGF